MHVLVYFKLLKTSSNNYFTKYLVSLFPKSQGRNYTSSMFIIPKLQRITILSIQICLPSGITFLVDADCVHKIHPQTASLHFKYFLNIYNLCYSEIILTSSMSRFQKSINQSKAILQSMEQTLSLVRCLFGGFCLVSFALFGFVGGCWFGLVFALFIFLKAKKNMRVFRN